MKTIIRNMFTEEQSKIYDSLMFLINQRLISDDLTCEELVVINELLCRLLFLGSTYFKDMLEKESQDPEKVVADILDDAIKLYNDLVKNLVHVDYEEEEKQ